MHEDYIIETGFDHPLYYQGSLDTDIYVIDDLPYVVENVDESYEEDYSDECSYAHIIDIFNYKVMIYGWVIIDGIEEVRRIVEDERDNENDMDWSDISHDDKAIRWYIEYYERNKRK